MSANKFAQKCETLGQLLNTMDSRVDGVAIANSLWRGLETGLRGWFYDRIFDWYEDVPLSTDDQVMLELRARNEVSFFQSVETAIVGKRFGYFNADLPWVIDWLARLNLGNEAADQALERRLPLYDHESVELRFDAFSETLAAVMPEKTGSFNWISRQVPLLAMNCAVVAATAFGDSQGLAEATMRYERLREMMDRPAQPTPGPPPAVMPNASGCMVVLLPLSSGVVYAVSRLLST